MSKLFNRLANPDFPAFFWSLMRSCNEGECWEWSRALNTSGYGILMFEGDIRLAHRVAWIITNGEIPDGLVVRHDCDNPLCCNPAHLLLGTQLDNIRDRCLRGRSARGDRAGVNRHPERMNQPRGAAHHKTHLTDADILQMATLHERGMDQPTIARRFHIDKSQVSMILRGKSWAHVQRPIFYKGVKIGYSGKVRGFA